MLVVTRFAPDTESLFGIDKLIDGWDKVLPGVLHIVDALRTIPPRVGPPLALPSVRSQLDPPGVATVGHSQQPVSMDGSVVVLVVDQSRLHLLVAVQVAVMPDFLKHLYFQCVNIFSQKDL